MTAFFTITLLLSVFGMVTLLGLKRYELRTGRVFFMQVRPAMGEFFGKSLSWVERALPELAARGLRRAYSSVRAALRTLTARIIIVAEHLLEQTLRSLRRTTDVPHHGEASAFLREVAEHKKKLMQDREDSSEA